MNKKAFAMKELVGIIIILLVLIVFVFFLIDLKKSSLNIIEDTECKSSIRSHILILKATGEASVPDIYCPTKYYTVPAGKDEDLNHYVAESLKTCWGTWGKGELQLFKEEGYFCHVCSVINFKGKPKKIEGLKDYLINTPIKPGEDYSYMDYIAGYASEKAHPDLINKIKEEGFADTIDTSKTYATMLVYAKDKAAIKSLLDSMDVLGLGTTGGGVTTGLAVGTAIGLTIASGGTAVVIAGIVTVVGGVVGFINADNVNWVSLVVFTEYDAPALNKIGCEIAPAKQDMEKDVLG